MIYCVIIMPVNVWFHFKALHILSCAH